MPHDPSVSLPDSLDLLRKEVDYSYGREPVSGFTLASMLCWLRTYTSSTKPGAKVLLPYSPWTGKGEKKRPFQKQRADFQEAFNIEVVHDLWGPDSGRTLDIGTREEEIYQLVEAGVADMMTDAQLDYDFNLAKLIGSGTAGITAYDGKPHYATNKEANPRRPGLKVFPNYNGALKLDKAGLITVFDAMDRAPWFDGRVRQYKGKLIVVVSNEDQYDRACEQLQTKIKAGTAVTAGATGIAVASTDNCLLGRAEVVKWTPLADYYGGKAWLTARIASDIRRPFIQSMVFPPRLKYEGEIVTDHYRVLQSAFMYAYEAMWGQGFGDPRLSFLAVEP